MSTLTLKVSVILSVYNGEKYLKKSISSILRQSYKNFELIIINDGSMDASEDIIISFLNKDKRIVYVKNKKNIGLTKSLIKAIKLSNGQIIFRQDADEYSSHERIEKQLKHFIDSSIVAVGCNSMAIYSNNKKFEWGYKKENELKKIIKIKTIFPHGSSSFRKNAYINCGGYDPNYLTCQDFDLWNKIIGKEE